MAMRCVISPKHGYGIFEENTNRSANFFVMNIHEGTESPRFDSETLKGFKDGLKTNVAEYCRLCRNALNENTVLDEIDFSMLY